MKTIFVLLAVGIILTFSLLATHELRQTKMSSVMEKQQKCPPHAGRKQVKIEPTILPGENSIYLTLASGEGMSLDEAAALLLDNATASETRREIALVLAQSGDKSAMQLLVLATLEAAQQGDEEFKGHALQAIAETNSPEAAEVLVDLLVPPANEIPAELRETVEKVLRRLPTETAEEAVVQRYESAFDDDERAALLDTRQPQLLAALVSEAVETGDAAGVDEKLEELSIVRDSTAMNALMDIARQGIVEPEKVNSAIYRWGQNQDEAVISALFADMISKKEASAAERIAAAYAIAGAGQESAKIALEKAIDHEEDIDALCGMEDALVVVGQPDTGYDSEHYTMDFIEKSR